MKTDIIYKNKKIIIKKLDLKEKNGESCLDQMSDNAPLWLEAICGINKNKYLKYFSWNIKIWLIQISEYFRSKPNQPLQSTTTTTVNASEEY